MQPIASAMSLWPEELIAYQKIHVDQSGEDQGDAERRRLFPWQTDGGGVAVNQQIRRKTGSLAQPGFAGEKGGGVLSQETGEPTGGSFCSRD